MRCAVERRSSTPPRPRFVTDRCATASQSAWRCNPVRSAMSQMPLTVERNGAVLTLTLDRAEAGNALTIPLAKAL